MTRDQWIDEAKLMLRQFCASLCDAQSCCSCAYNTDVPACRRYNELMSKDRLNLEPDPDLPAPPTKRVDLPAGI